VRRVREHWVVFVVAVVLLWPFPFLERIRPPQELTRLYQIRAIVEDGTLQLNEMLARYGERYDLSEYEGRIYPNKAPGVSFLGVPVYWVYANASSRPYEAITEREGVWILEKVLLALPTLAMLVWMRRFVLRHFTRDRWAVDAALTTWAVGSVALAYSLVLFGHQLAALLLFGSLMAYVRGRDGPGAWVALGAFLSGLAVAVEYTVAPAVVVLGIYALLAGAGREPALRLKRALHRAALGIAGAAGPIALLLGYHHTAFGSPWSTPYSYNLSQQRVSLAGADALGWLMPRLDFLGGFLFGEQGLLTYSPWLLLAVLGMILLWRRPAERGLARVLLAIAAVYLWFAAVWDPESWGWVVGPRHHTAWMPFLVGPVALSLAWLRARPAPAGPRLAGAALGLCGFSMVMHALICLTWPYVPPDYDNPVFQLALPLLRDGYGVHNLGGFWLGAAGAWTLAPVGISIVAAIVALGALWPGDAPPRARLKALGTCLVVIAAALGLQSLRGTPHPVLVDHWQFVTARYTPKPGGSPGRLFGTSHADADAEGGDVGAP
jgi:hypothetical protein